MIARKAILAFGVNLLKNGIGYVGLFFVARRLGPEIFGALSYGFAYVGIFHFIADMGFGVAHIKKLSEGRDLPTCLGTYLLVRAGMTGLMAIAVLGSLAAHRLIFHQPMESAAHEQVILIAVLTFVLIDLAQIPSGTFAARKETAKQMIPDLAGKTIETALKIAVAVAGLGVVLLAGASLAGALVGLLLYAYIFKSYAIGRPSWSMAKEYLLFALPIMVIVSANAVTENLDQIMIQHFWKSGELGLYAGAAKITTILMFAGTAVGTLVFPTVSALNSERDLAGIRTLTHRAERFSALVLFPVGALLMMNRHTVVRLLLGSTFEASNSVLTFLIWSSIVSVISVPYFTQIIGTSRVSLSAALSVTFMVLNVIMNLVFIPVSWGGWTLAGMGARGAALATLLSGVIMAVLYRYCAYRSTATTFNISVLRIGVATAIMMAAMGVISGFMERTLWHDCLSSVAGIGVFVGVLSLMGEKIREDLGYLLQAVSPGRMSVYIRDEFRAPQVSVEEHP